MRRVIGQGSNPHLILQTRIRLDRALYDDFGDEELDIDPLVDVDDVDEMVEEFGYENVQLAYYYIHRHQLFDLKILSVDDLEWDDVLAFLLVGEEKSCHEAQESARLKSQTERLR